MSVGYIAVTVFIAGQIVEVADISIIGNSVIKLNHRIFRLNDGQLREMSNGCFIFFISHGTGKTIGSHQATGRYITAILINTSRGPVVDEADLAAALTSGKLSAAAVDVLCQEPPADGSPLIGLSNCIVTPHIAWAPREARLRLLDVAAANLRGWLAGAQGRPALLRVMPNTPAAIGRLVRKTRGR